MATRQGQGRLRAPWGTSARTSSTSRSSSPASHRPRLGAAPHLRQASAAAGRARGPVRDRSAPAEDLSPSTTLRCSSRSSAAVRWGSSKPPGSPPAARTRSGIEINGSRGSLAFDFEDMNVLHYYDGAEPPPRPASGGSWSPSPSTPTSPPGGRRVTCSATSTPSPTRSSTSCATSPRAPTPPPRSPTGCRSSACSPPSRPAPTPAPGRRSP